VIKAYLHLWAQRASRSLHPRTTAVPTIPWAVWVGVYVGMLFFCKDNCGSWTDKIARGELRALWFTSRSTWLPGSTTPKVLNLEPQAYELSYARIVSVMRELTIQR